MRQLLIATLLASAMGLSASEAQAQGARPPIILGQFGFQVASSSNSAGTLCSGFSCSAARLVAKPNQQLTFTIRAPQNARYFVIVGPSPTLCQTFPGFLNKWVVPATILLPGTVNQVDTGPKCFGYKSSFTVTVPGNVKKGARVAFQALAEVRDRQNRTVPAFSSAIDIVVL